MGTPTARTMASRMSALASAPVGSSPLPRRSALPILSRRRIEIAAKVASVPQTVEGRETRESPQRSRSLHRHHFGVAAASSSSASSEPQKAKTTKQRRSRSRSRKRLLPSLEDLRPQRGEGAEDGNDSSAALLSVAASPSPSTPASTSSSTNSVLSAVALIVGSSVGAGVLALPAVSAPAGLAPSAVALVGVWALLTAEALLIAEVNLSLLGAKKRERRARGGGRGGASEPGVDFADEADEEDAIVTLREMAHETLGERGGHFVAAAYLALSYSLMVAYISKAGELVSSALDPLLLLSAASVVSGGGSSDAAVSASASSLGSVSPATGAALFTAAMGLTLFGGTAAVDGANKAMTLSLLLAYAVIVAVGGAQAEWGALAERAPDWGAAPAAIPVILLSLVYHDLVPVVCAQLRGDAAKVRTALFVGSAAPLAMFILVSFFPPPFIRPLSRPKRLLRMHEPETYTFKHQQQKKSGTPSPSRSSEEVPTAAAAASSAKRSPPPQRQRRSSTRSRCSSPREEAQSGPPSGPFRCSRSSPRAWAPRWACLRR